MNHYAIQRNGVVRLQEETRSSCSVAATATMFLPDHHLHRRREAVVCPKPRRAGLSGAINGPSRSIGWHFSQPAEHSDSKAGFELLDIILPKGGGPSSFDRYGTNNSTQVASSPPFFRGSPPSRVSNPLIQDARFVEEKLLPNPSPSSPAPSSGGRLKTNFGNKPTVRVEGFDCLDRERSKNCKIPALA